MNTEKGINIMKKAAFFGAGRIALNLYYVFKDLFHLECCYDNDEGKWGGYLYDIPIQKIENKNFFIIITTDFWDEVAKQLEKMQLRLFRDYVPYFLFDYLNGGVRYSVYYNLKKNFWNGKYFEKTVEYLGFLPDKKLAIVYGNCQTGIFENALMLNDEFKENFIICKTPKVCEYLENPDMLISFLEDTLFWSKVDLFIYQTVKDDNRFFRGLSTNCVLGKLDDKCKRVNIVNLYFKGYFPQAIHLDRPEFGLFHYRDNKVEELVKQGLDKDEILHMLEEDNIFSTDEINNSIQDSFNELKKREAAADVKIIDFIEDNYRKEQLFYSFNHPCNILMIEYTKRILKHLGYAWNKISNVDFFLKCNTLKAMDIPVYPAVIKKIGVKNYEQSYYLDRYQINSSFGFRRCMEMYLDQIFSTK